MTNPRVPATEADQVTEAAIGLDHVADALREVHILGRDGINDAAYDASMLGQIAAVERAASMLHRLAHQPSVDREAVAQSIKIAKALCDRRGWFWINLSAEQQAMFKADADAILALASSAPAEKVGDTTEDGWCRRCGCGNDQRGFAHLTKCPTTRDESGLREAVFDAAHVFERLRDLTPARANETTAQGFHGAIKAIAASALDRMDAALATNGSAS